MRILLFSDSHGNIHNMAKAMNTAKGAKKAGKVDLVIHLGDCVSDMLRLMEMFPGPAYEFVQGNNDWARGYPSEKTLELDGMKIIITHGHLYNVKYDYQRLVSRGKASGANAVFFGHTHEAEEFFSDGMLVLNPGSIGGLRPEPPRSTYCDILLADGRITSKFQSI